MMFILRQVGQGRFNTYKVVKNRTAKVEFKWCFRWEK